MMKGEEFYLYWERDRLEGWEVGKSSLVVAAMVEGIKLGHKFPSVYVVKIEDNFYRLAYGREDSTGFDDGGHHRALAHYIEGKSLRCHSSRWADTMSFLSVSDIEMMDYVNICKLRDSLGRLPLDIADKFCRDNDLDPRDYLSQ